MKAQCLLYHLYRAWEERSDWSESDSSIQPLLSSDWSESDSSIQPLLSSDWSESDSSIQPLLSSDWSNMIAVSSHCHALCLPVGGASLANDGRSECGVNKCGEALRSTSRSALHACRSASASASSHTNLEPLVIFFFFFFIIIIIIFLLLFFFFFIIFILLYLILF